MKPGNVDSHIQMPRFLLSRFENEHHSFFYYDVSKGFIGTNGHAKTLNTEHGYYPNEIEKLLSDEIEKPFSQILRFIDLLDLEQPSFTMNTIDENNIKQFLISLIVRSPLFIDSIGKNSVFFDFFSQTDQHAMAILQGMQEAQKLKLFDDYRVTFTVNKTKKPFILPISGLYHDTPLDSHMQDRLKHQTEMGIVEHIDRSKYVLSRRLYSAVGKSGVHTRIVGLDRETNKELLIKHMREKGPEGAPLKELQQVLPGHNRSQIQVLLRELRNENRAYFRGNTSAAKWFAGPSPAEDN